MLFRSLGQLELDDGSLYYNQQRQNATYQGRQAWIEWHDVREVAVKARRPRTSDIQNRIRLLTDLLTVEKPYGFRAPPCLGYVTDPANSNHDIERFGIIFAKPSNADAASELTTLGKLLEKAPKPSLSARMRLCATLARSVHILHTVNWIHKGIRSQNVIFFVTSDPARQADPNLDSPFLTGFTLSRPSILNQVTEKPAFDPLQDIYRHPLAQSGESDERYKRSFDLYSLGIVLIEIGLWKPIENVVGFADVDAIRPQQLRVLKNWLLGQLSGSDLDLGMPLSSSERPCLERIAVECGDVVQGVVRLCLMADQVDRPRSWDESDESIGLRVQRLLWNGVVMRMEEVADAL